MVYTAAIALYVARKAARVGLPFFILSLLLALTAFSHGIHHLFAFTQTRSLELAFEFVAAASALGLAVTYAYVWRRY